MWWGKLKSTSLRPLQLTNFSIFQDIINIRKIGGAIKISLNTRKIDPDVMYVSKKPLKGPSVNP